MSLVNKMLRDLDARRASGGERAGLPAALTPLAARQEPARAPAWIWPAALVAVASLGGAIWYSSWSGRGTPQAPTIAAGPAAPVVQIAPAATVPAVAVVQAPPAAVVEPPIVAPPATAEKATLPVLRMAEQLTQPPAPGSASARKLAVPAPKPPATASAEAVTTAPVALAVRKPALPNVESRIEKQPRLPSPAERAEIEYRRGVLAQQQGNVDEAAAGYRAALADSPVHTAARQRLASLLIEARHFDDAEEVLRSGTEVPAVRLPSALALARLKVERNQASAALELLLQHASAGERSAEYQGFLGALLNRAGRAAEAVERYQMATRLAPNEARWWAGLGIALDSSGKTAEAREAYQKARSLPGLPADLAQHAEQRLR